ncbi:fibronectin type III domain-containing protein [Candidatus Bipolaricaulota bacterium]|nr:fibronectin type III domain-containing protein [Candidatus Bipolaricaulota bacterium]
MPRVWRYTLVALVLLLSLLFSAVPFSQTEQQNTKYTYRYGCPVWEAEEKSYCPERYESLTSAKSSYAKGEEVKITMTNLRDFEYKVDKVEVHFKPLFEHGFDLIYTEKNLGAIPRSKDRWTWVWDQRNAAGELVGAGRAYARVTFSCCKNYRVYFRISQSGGGEISVSEEPEQEATVQAPQRPGNFDYRIFSPAEVELTWEDTSEDEDGFRVYRNGNRIASLGPNSDSYTDTDVEAGESYNYRVASYNEAGESSTSQSLTVQFPTEVPASPGGLSSSVMSPTKIRLSWEDNSDNEDGFRIYRNGNEVATVGANVTEFTDTGLQGNMKYTYRVSSYNEGGESGLSNGLSVSTPVQVSKMPGSLSSEILSPTEIRLTWVDNSDNENGFRVYRNGKRIADLSPNTTEYVDTGLRENTSYTYRVSSYNQAGESSFSTSLDVTTPVGIPSTPGSLRTKTLSPSRIKLNWEDNSDNEKGFRIYRDGSRISTVGPNVTSFVHKGLQGETRYCYEVVAYNSSGESESTNRNCAMTQKSIPKLPQNLNARPLSTSEIRLTWNDTSDNEDGFRIYRNGVEIVTLAPNTTSYTDTGLDPGSSYSYEVSAYNSSGESGLSSSGTVTTPAAEEPEPQPEPTEEEPPISQQQLLAGIGVVLMVMGYIYAEMG